MTINIWIPMAIVAGIAAAFFYRKKDALAATVIVAVPPVLLCLYVVAERPGEAVQSVWVSGAWLVAAGLAAVCTSFWLHRPKQNP
jgi:uncharacterized membrane protein HdeD (DUF308 family)